MKQMKNKNRKSILQGIILVVCLIMFVACLPGQVYAAEKTALNKTKVSIYIGKKVQLELSEYDGEIKWSSSDQSIAKVSSNGKVTGVAAGTATIKAKTSEKTYKCKVTVKEAELNKQSVNLKKGKKVQLKLKGAKAVSWSSKDKKVASVTKDGLVKGKSAGIATITCTDKNGNTYDCKVSVVLDKTSIYKAMTKMEKTYPEGTPWDNSNYYAWNGGIFSGGFGCAGFAFMLSDAAFGTLPARTHEDFDNIKVGDILRINYDTHSVIVLEVKKDSVIVAEGNYNSSVHWRREISLSSIKKTGEYVMTRYPE